jgi:hypothetical protein
MATYGDDEAALKATLVEMARQAWNDSLGRGTDPALKLAEYIETDSRLQPYNAESLAREALDQVRKGNSRNIDLGANLKTGSNRYVPHR